MILHEYNCYEYNLILYNVEIHFILYTLHCFILYSCITDYYVIGFRLDLECFEKFNNIYCGKLLELYK